VINDILLPLKRKGFIIYRMFTNRLNKKHKKIRAFTLAEVLITLGIIGVVAALTIPTLMQSADERATVTALKKSYSTLSQAYTMAVKDNGSPESWFPTHFGYHPELVALLAPYLNVDKLCIDNATSSGVGTPGCWPQVVYKWGGLLRGTGANNYDSDSYPKMRLADGTLIEAQFLDETCSIDYGDTAALSSVCAQYFVDVNGFKGPNRWGYDTFAFYLTKYGIIPFGSQQETPGTFATYCKNPSIDDYGVGNACAAWLIFNNNMDYVHCDGLAWSGKTKCN
jgi:prepilin-type N-terminal cleavage/methylation domain-containing protein